MTHMCQYKIRQRDKVLQQAGMPLTNIEPNIDYRLGLMKRNENRNHSFQGMLIYPIRVHARVVPITLCQHSSPGCGNWETWIPTQNTEQIPSERTVQHCSVQTLNRVCTMQLSKIHENLRKTQDRAYPKEDITLLLPTLID